MKRFSFFLLLCSSLWLAGCTKNSDSDTLIGNWVRRSDFEGVGRSEAITAVLDGKAYVGLGYNGTDRLADLWVYDNTADFWQKKADFPGTPRNSAVAFAAGGKIYVGLGYDGVNYLKDFWAYDPAANSWTQVADFGGSARYEAVAFSLNDKGYVCSGNDGNYLKDFWSYNPTTNTWTQEISPGGTKRSAASVFVIDNKAYLCLGENNGATVNELWMYDGASAEWTEKRKLTNVSSDSYDDKYTGITRSNAVAFTIDGKGYITTGTIGSGSGLTSNTWEYNPADDTWLQKTAFDGTAREGAVGFSVNNRGYVSAGRTLTLRLDDTREFQPNADNDTNDN
ncbi:MAG: hypothetical protein QM664_13635 [Flavihumibacter sp.]